MSIASSTKIAILPPWCLFTAWPDQWTSYLLVLSLVVLSITHASVSSLLTSCNPHIASLARLIWWTHVYVKAMELSTYYRFQHFVGKTRTVEISTIPEDAVFFQVQILCRDDTYTDARALRKNTSPCKGHTNGRCRKKTPYLNTFDRNNALRTRDTSDETIKYPNFRR